MKYKIIITYVEAGIGHIVSAEAVANALMKYYPDEIEVKKVYLYHEGTEKLREHEEFLIQEVKRGYKHKLHLWSQIFWQYLLTPMGTLKLSYSVAFPKEKKECIEIFNSYNPDMILSTHYESLHFSIEGKKKGAKYIAAAYNPDVNTHGWWDNRADMFFVNNPFAKEEAVTMRKMKSENVYDCGFVLREEVTSAIKDKSFYRRKYGIAEDCFTIIIADGAYANARLKLFADKLLKINKKFTLIIIAGKNNELFDYYTEIAQKSKNIDIKVFRFTTEIHELYCASDLFITKAGPNAILDSVYMGTPVLTNYYTGPIELKTKMLYIDTYKVGIHETNPEKAMEIVSNFIDDKNLLEPYKENCRKFAENVVGAKKIADEIMNKLKEKK